MRSLTLGAVWWRADARHSADVGRAARPALLPLLLCAGGNARLSPASVIASVGRSGRLTIYSVWLVLVWDSLQITKFTHGTRTLVLLARGSADCPALLFRLSYFVFVWCIAVSHFFYGDVMVKGTQI